MSSIVIPSSVGTGSKRSFMTISTGLRPALAPGSSAHPPDVSPTPRAGGIGLLLLAEWLAGLMQLSALFGTPCEKPCEKPGLPDGMDSDALAGDSAAIGAAASFGTLRRLNLAPNLAPNLEANAAVEGESPEGAHASPSAWPLSRLPLPVTAATSAKDLSVPGAGSTLGGFADGAHFPLRYSVLKSMQCAAAETQQRIVIARPPTTQPPRAASLMVGEHGGGGRGGGGGAAGEGALPGNRGGHKGGDGGDGTGGGGGRKLGGGG
jgi:hypothetical protein